MKEKRIADENESRPHVAVVGGGISGLAAAFRLTEIAANCRVTLFEAANRLGGILQTDRRDGFLIEQSADGFITDPSWALDFCERIGFSDELIETNAGHRRAMVVCDGRLVPVPEGFVLMSPGSIGPLLRSPLLDWQGKLRIACEYFVSPRKGEADESVAAFARRRLGKEAFERLLQPLLAGLYTADPEKLSVVATLPQLVEQEREYGSLIRAAWNRRRAGTTDSGARYSLFVAPRNGMGSLVQAIESRLPRGSVQLGRKVGRLEPVGDRWRFYVGNEREPHATVDAVIVALESHHAADALQSMDEQLALSLREIEYAGVAVVTLGFRRNEIKHALDAFGFVVPAIERRRILSASFASVKYRGRAPEGMELLRVYVGGAMSPELVSLPDAEMYELVGNELRLLIGLDGEPVYRRIARWARAMPQYHVGHFDRIDRIETAVRRWPGLELAGNAYRGVGIPHCIRSGEQAAERVARGLYSM